MTARGDDRKLMHWIASHGYTVYAPAAATGRYSMTACCSRRRAARPRTGEAPQLHTRFKETNMFNLASKIRHCCPLYGCVPLIFEWRGRYMFFCTHLEAPYADTREEAWDKWCGMVENIWERDRK